MKKTDFLKNGPSYILPTIKYVISEPHGDLLHWNLSWASTFNFLVHEERGEWQSFSNDMAQTMNYGGPKTKTPS